MFSTSTRGIRTKPQAGLLEAMRPSCAHPPYRGGSAWQVVLVVIGVGDCRLGNEEIGS